MRGQAQIIVRGKVDDLFAVECAFRCLLVLEHTQAEMRALGFQLVQLVGQIRKRISAGRGSHKSPNDSCKQISVTLLRLPILAAGCPTLVAFSATEPALSEAEGGDFDSLSDACHK